MTGATGYLGSSICRLLARDRVAHVGVDVVPDGRDVHVFDLRDRAALRALVGDFAPDVVVHAGTFSALAYRDDLRRCFRADLDAAESLLDAIPASCRLVYFSSSYVASGLPADQVVTEESPLRPRHPFGVAKWAFEELVMRSHASSVVFRLCSVFGPGEARFPNAIEAMAAEATTSGRVTVWGSGGRRTQYVYIDDVLECVVAAADLEPGLFHLGGDERVTVAAAAGAIARHVSAEVVFDRQRAEGETLPLLDTARLKRATGRPDLFQPFERALTASLGSRGG